MRSGQHDRPAHNVLGSGLELPGHFSVGEYNCLLDVCHIAFFCQLEKNSELQAEGKQFPTCAHVVMLLMSACERDGTEWRQKLAPFR